MNQHRIDAVEMKVLRDLHMLRPGVTINSTVVSFAKQKQGFCDGTPVIGSAILNIIGTKEAYISGEGVGVSDIGIQVFAQVRNQYIETGGYYLRPSNPMSMGKLDDE